MPRSLTHSAASWPLRRRKHASMVRWWRRCAAVGWSCSSAAHGIRDPQWGPVIAVGLGGVWVEVLQDVSLRPLPIDAAEVMRMLGALRGAKMLQGMRGTPAADLDSAAVIARIGDAAVAFGDDLEALEVNPLWVRGAEVEALDALAVWRRT